MLGLVCGFLFAFTPIAEPATASYGGQNDSATIVVYRLRDFQGALYTLKVNQKLITKSFKMYQYIQFNVPAGEVVFETSGNILVEKKRFTKQVSAGKTYYLEAVVDYSYASSTLLLYQREEEEALAIMPKLTEKGKRW
ncbi:MAG: hypothetical protein ACK417_09445 [Bacteroidia bacterium]